MHCGLIFLVSCLVLSRTYGRSLVNGVQLGRIQKLPARVRRAASNADIAITEHNNRKLQTLLRQLYLHRLLENMTKRGTSVPSQTDITSTSTTETDGPNDEVYRIIDYKRDLMSNAQNIRALVAKKWLSSLEPSEVERLLTSGENLQEAGGGRMADGYKYKDVEFALSPYEDSFDYVPVSYDLVD